MFERSPVFGGDADDKLVSASEGRRLAGFADALARWSVYLSLVLLPVFYWTSFGDPLELPKQSLLIALTVVATLSWLGKMLVTRRLEMRRSVMHLFVGVYLVIYAVSSWLSQNRYMSLVGDFGQQKAGLATLACFVLLYFVAVNVLRDAKDVKKALGWLALGSLLVVAMAMLQALGLRFLPGAAKQTAAFNPIGTTNALGAYAAMAAVLVMGLMLMPWKGDRFAAPKKIVMFILLGLSGIYIAALQFWALWLMVIVGCLVLVAFGMVKNDRDLQITMLAVPMAAMVVSALLIFIRAPFSMGLPAEVMPSLRASWNISKEALASQPLFGSGPGTFVYDYTKFRSKELNGTSFWNISFDRAASRLLTQLATTGILGLAAYALMLLFLAVRTKLKLWRGHDDWLVTLAVFAAWTTLLVGKIVYSSNLSLEFVFWMLTAMLVALQWHRWSEAKFDQSPRAALLLSFCFIVAVIFSVAGLYLQGQRLVAEMHYQRGVTADLNKAENLDYATKELLRASQLNGRNDLYFRALSQALAVQANVAVQKAGAKPTDEQIRGFTLLAVNAVNAGKQATVLNPSSVDAWDSLGGMYRDLGPAVAGAVDAAMEAYGRASELAPSNPIYPTEIAKLRLTQADAYQQQIGRDTPQDQKTDLEKKIGEERAKAREQLEKAIAMKQDYAAANYWMAVLFAREGKAKEAVTQLEKVRNQNPNDLGIGFQLAIIYYQNNQKNEAIGELERLISLEPNYSNARWYLAAMLEEKGDIAGAVSQVEQVLKANPDNEDVKKRLEELKAKGTGASTGLPEPVKP